MTKSLSHARWFLAPYCIGMKLRALRTEKRLTLARLSSETGLSTALLSKLETDRMVPTLATLAAICRVYGVGLGHFFHEPTEHALAVTRQLSNQGRGRNPDPGGRIPLNASIPGRQLNASLIDLAPGPSAPSPSPNDPRPNATGALLVYVVDGRLHLDMGGIRETLDSGDCAYLESDLPVNWSAAGKQLCRLLTVSPENPHQGAPREPAISSSISAP